ncbi:hypothetical protein CTEN210_12943 [Chaetoceros tenuissimus]|uniref:Uncharacterized protein n=1 Tax=Chaetoceros tenuissimus TaxID=426638 RepID=A0AAD3D2M7_9STRA|nr:hypothetical protein CTEN210_12943 [Chaetoceros tenuissimus]
MSSFKRIKVAHEADKDMRSSSPISIVNDDNKHIQDLPNDVFRHCLEFVGKGNFAFIAPVSKHFYWNYINLGVEMKNNVIDVDVILQQGRNKRTTVKDVATGSIRLATECFLNASSEFQEEVCRQAAVNGRLDILKCAVAFGIDMKNSVFPCHTADGRLQLVETIVNGHLEVIEFLHDQGVYLDNDDIIWKIRTRDKSSSLHWMASKGIISDREDEVFNYLVEDGEIEILKESYKDFAQYMDEDTFDGCAESGNIEVMNWLLQENDCEWNSSLFSTAARSGSIPMMELCLQNGCPPCEDICSSAMQNTNQEAALKGLIWLREKKIPWDKRVCENAAMYGNFKAFKWARENGCPWDEETFYSAACFGHVDILDYCFENNCPMGDDINYHVSFDHDPVVFETIDRTEMEERLLKVYKWLHQHSIPWDNTVSLEAAKEQYWKTLMWAIENGCPLHEDVLLCAIGECNIPMVEYCLSQLSSTEDNIYVLAINKMMHRRMNDLQMIEMLQKIHDCGIPWSRDIIPCAERLGRSNVASWLRCAGCD